MTPDALYWVPGAMLARGISTCAVFAAKIDPIGMVVARVTVSVFAVHEGQALQVGLTVTLGVIVVLMVGRAHVEFRASTDGIQRRAAANRSQRNRLLDSMIEGTENTASTYNASQT